MTTTNDPNVAPPAPREHAIENNIRVGDTEKMVADLERSERQITQSYVDRGIPLPSPEHLREQARCAWVYGTLIGIRQQERQELEAQAERARQVRIGRPAIIVPPGLRR